MFIMKPHSSICVNIESLQEYMHILCLYDAGHLIWTMLIIFLWIIMWMCYTVWYYLNSFVVPSGRREFPQSTWGQQWIRSFCRTFTSPGSILPFRWVELPDTGGERWRAWNRIKAAQKQRRVRLNVKVKKVVSSLEDGGGTAATVNAGVAGVSALRKYALVSEGRRGRRGAGRGEM